MPTRSFEQVPFYFMRHGETDWNREHRYMGQQDIPLNETGINQAQQAADFVKSIGIQQICHSPLSRARHTAEIIANALNVPMISVDSLKEVHWGEFEGQLKQTNLTIFEKWLQGSGPQGSESRINVEKRVLIALGQCLTKNGTTLIISHGGIYNIMRFVLEKMESPVRTHNCQLSHFVPPTAQLEQWSVKSLPFERE